MKAALEAGEVTLASLVPTMLQRLRAAGLSRTPGLRAIALGGGPIAPGLLEWAVERGIPVVPVYGMTETCSQVVAGSPGRALRGVELRVAGDGEVLVRGAMVARGAAGADGWLHTGDLGRLDRHGLLQLAGRKKELIVTGGENVAPLEVERALLSHPAVADAGVAGLADETWGEAIAAYVVTSSPVAEHELQAWCRERLDGFKVPKHVVSVRELPRTANGKLMRSRLHDLESDVGSVRSARLRCGICRRCHTCRGAVTQARRRACCGRGIRPSWIDGLRDGQVRTVTAKPRYGSVTKPTARPRPPLVAAV